MARKSKAAGSWVVRDFDNAGRPVVDLHYLGRVAHPGDVLDDLPDASAKWLARDGVIRPADEQED